MPPPVSPRKQSECTPDVAVTGIVRVCHVLHPPVAVDTV